jgi:hypothetical protein
VVKKAKGKGQRGKGRRQKAEGRRQRNAGCKLQVAGKYNYKFRDFDSTGRPETLNLKPATDT